MNVLDKIRTVPDFPKKGIMFKDITTLLGDAEAFAHLIHGLRDRYKGERITHIAGIESRGFIFGSALAPLIGAGFVPIRKAGKLPHRTRRRSYALEYGEATIEVHEDALGPGDRVLIVDDVLATGGTMKAAVDVVRELGAEVAGSWVLLELGFLGGRRHLADVAHHSEAVIEKE